MHAGCCALRYVDARRRTSTHGAARYVFVRHRTTLRVAAWPGTASIDLFVFICVYFVCFCFILHMCCIIVSTVGWTLWD